MYRDIIHAASWDSLFPLSDDAVGKVLFWKENFHNNGPPIWCQNPKLEVFMFSDASEFGWGSFMAQLGGQTAVGSWSLEEMGKRSTFR